MKVCGQVMKVTLTVHGRERTFSEQELIAILEKHFSNETTEQVSTAKLVQVPTEGKWFEIKPQSIDQNLFQNKRENREQEKTRKLILEAFDEVKNSPAQYGKNFKTMRPKNTWTVKTVAELNQLACELGDHNADWVEQALEWAQRICNGESWKSVCNARDTAKWPRLVIWKNGYARIVGGSCSNCCDPPASYVCNNDYSSSDEIYYAVPLPVLYEK